MHCSRCGHENKEGAKFCNECGSKLEVTCAACSTANPPGSKFCSECGSPLGIEADRHRGGQEDKVAQVEPLAAGRGLTKPVLSKGEGLTTGGAPEAERRQSAKSWELRAVMSLSRLLQKQGKKEEARQMLAEIYGWFTERMGLRRQT